MSNKKRLLFCKGKIKRCFAGLLTAYILILGLGAFFKPLAAYAYTTGDVKNELIWGSGTVLIVKDGKVYSWGRNNGMAAAQDPNTLGAFISEPTLIDGLSNIVAVADCMALDKDGKVWTWGSNLDGELGIGTFNDGTYQPQYVSSLGNNVKAIASYTDFLNGRSYRLALDKSGQVWAWGDNKANKLADPSAEHIAIPQKISSLSNIAAISAGASHVLALDSDGYVWQWGAFVATPFKLSGLNNIVAISAGYEIQAPDNSYWYPSMALDKDGKVWTWEWDRKTGTMQNFKMVNELSNIIAIDCFTHYMALDRDGDVWTWGKNFHGQLGDGTKTSSAVPKKVDEISNVIAVSTRTATSVVKTSDGSVWAWGYLPNYDGSGYKEVLWPEIVKGFGQSASIARAALGGENSTELFLHGKYIELGISNWGDFGTLGSKPKGFRGTRGGETNSYSGSDRIGMSADHDGFKEGRDLPVDYYLPGCPEERFVVGYKQEGTTYSNTNSAQMGDKNMTTTVLNLSDVENEKLKAKVVSEWEGKLKVTQIISFDSDKQYYRNEVTMQNISGELMENVRYMRNFDPDNTQFRGGQFPTRNEILYTHEAGDGKAVVMAETIDDNDPLYQAFNSRTPIFYYSKDPRARVSTFGFVNKNPFDPLAYDNARPKGFEETADKAINITYDAGDLAPGQESDTFVYYTSLDNRVFEEVIEDIETDEAATVNTPVEIGEGGPAYTVTFLDFDDSVISEISVNEGLPATLPADPMRAGYIFTGWEVQGSGSLSNVTADMQAKAGYAPMGDPKTVSFDSMGGSSVASITVEAGSTIDEPEIPEKEGYIFKGWVTEAGGNTLWNFAANTVASDTTLYAAWEDIENKTYFKSAQSVENIEVPIGTSSSDALGQLPATISITDTAGADHDVSLTWSWNLTPGAEYNPYEPGYYEAAGSFDLPEGIYWENDQPVKVKAVVYIVEISKRVTGVKIVNKSEIVSAGQNILNRGEQLSLSYSVEPVDADVQTAKWESSDESVALVDDSGKITPTGPGIANIRVITDDGGLTDSILVTVNPSDECEIIEWHTPNNPVIEGTIVSKTVASSVDSQTVNVSVSEHATWKLYRDAACTEELAEKVVNLDTGTNTYYIKVTAEDAISTKSYTLIINRKEAHTVAFESNGGSEVPAQSVDHDSTLAAPPEPARIGFIFGGWYADEALTAPYGFDAPVTADITLYAKWISNGEAYVLAEPDTIKTGSYAQKEFLLILENDSIKQDITNDDVSLGGVFSGLSVEVLGYTDTTVTAAVYESVYGVFDQKGIGEIIINPEVLDKSDTPLSAKITVKGEYIVKFLDDEGNVLKEEDVVRGESAAEPVPPEKEGYAFIGWDKEFNNVASDLTVTAEYEIKKYIIQYNSNGGSDVPNQTANHNERASEPSEPARTGYTFRGWYADEALTAPYDFDTPVTEDVTLYAKWIKNSRDEETNKKESGKETGILVIVNGQNQIAGKEAVKKENYLTTVEISVEPKPVIQKIEEVLKAQADQKYESTVNTVEIPVGEKEANIVIAKLSGDILKQMEENKFNLSINTGEIKYMIPAEEINIENAARMLGVDREDITKIETEIKIDKLEAPIIETIKEEAKQRNLEVIVSPVDFQVTARINAKGSEKKVTISKYDKYVERIIEIPEGIDPNRITTGVVYNSDGSFSHIPTQVFIIDNKYYAKLNSLTNSIYSVIWNPITVSSVEKHWSKESVNDMASRLVIKNPDGFVPDKPITRGDFAEYITKALGVYRTGAAKEEPFADVLVSDELADAIAIAKEYGIIKGYPDNTFRAKALITREEAMVMFARAMDVVKLQEKDSSRIQNYEDKEQVSAWAYDAVKKTLGSCVFNGRSIDTIAPQGTFTYAEAATAVRNLLIEAGLINK